MTLFDRNAQKLLHALGGLFTKAGTAEQGEKWEG